MSFRRSIERTRGSDDRPRPGAHRRRQRFGKLTGCLSIYSVDRDENATPAVVLRNLADEILENVCVLSRCHEASIGHARRREQRMLVPADQFFHVKYPLFHALSFVSMDRSVPFIQHIESHADQLHVRSARSAQYLSAGIANRPSSAVSTLSGRARVLLSNCPAVTAPLRMM